MKVSILSNVEHRLHHRSTSEFLIRLGMMFLTNFNRRSILDVTKSDTTETFKPSASCEDHDYDIVQELNHRLDSLCRHDQHIANAKGHSHLQAYWSQVKIQDRVNIKTLKTLINEEIKMGYF
jgi:hypothetical protein